MAKLPNLLELEKISKKIKNFPNQRKERLRGVHYGCYLLCSEAGLRISEAVGFDLGNKTKKGLYKIIKPKGKKERLVFIPNKVIHELKSQNWKPNQTNRWNFYHFLRKIKQKTNINPKIELTPHNLRRSFATRHAEKGIPLPLLQKLLGHSSIRTTALYWQNIYGEDEPSDILAGKRWLENKEREPAEPPEIENFSEPLPENFPPPPPPRNFEPENKLVITGEKSGYKDNSLLTNDKEKNLAINFQPKAEIREILPKLPKNLLLENQSASSQQLPANEKEFLLTKIKQLEEQLTKFQTENTNLKLENKHLKALIKQELGTEAQTLQLLTHK